MSYHGEPFPLVDIYANRANWPTILDDLKSKGVSLKQAATHLGIPWTTVARWAHGAEPRHASGEALLKFHEAVCGRELNGTRRREAAPSFDAKAFAITAISA